MTNRPDYRQSRFGRRRPFGLFFYASGGPIRRPSLKKSDKSLPTKVLRLLVFRPRPIDRLHSRNMAPRDDAWIAANLAKRLGIPADVLGPPSAAEQRVYNTIAGAWILADDGETREPLFTITAEDIEELGAQGEPQQGRVDGKHLSEGSERSTQSPSSALELAQGLHRELLE